MAAWVNEFYRLVMMLNLTRKRSSHSRPAFHVISSIQYTSFSTMIVSNEELYFGIDYKGFHCLSRSSLLRLFPTSFHYADLQLLYM